MILNGRIARRARIGARLCQLFAVCLFCGMLMARPAAAQQTDSKSYAILEADRFPFSLPESCAPRLGVAVNLQTGSLVFRTSSLPPNDPATVQAVERCLGDLRPITQNPRVTYFGSLIEAREKWRQGNLEGAPAPGASSAVSGQPVFAVTRSGTRLAIEGYEIAGERIRLRLIGGGTLEWAKEEIARIERADGTQIEPPSPPAPATRTLPGREPASLIPQEPIPARPRQPSSKSPTKAKEPPPKATIRSRTEAETAASPPETPQRVPQGRAPTFSARGSIPPPGAKGCCVLQLGSFRVRANAERLAQELTPKQPNVRIVSGLTGNSEMVYRVRIPVAGTRVEAEKLARQLRAEGFEVIILTRR